MTDQARRRNKVAGTALALAYVALVLSLFGGIALCHQNCVDKIYDAASMFRLK